MGNKEFEDFFDFDSDNKEEKKSEKEVENTEVSDAETNTSTSDNAPSLSEDTFDDAFDSLQFSEDEGQSPSEPKTPRVEEKDAISLDVETTAFSSHATSGGPEKSDGISDAADSEMHSDDSLDSAAFSADDLDLGFSQGEDTPENEADVPLSPSGNKANTGEESPFGELDSDDLNLSEDASQTQDASLPQDSLEDQLNALENDSEPSDTTSLDDMDDIFADFLNEEKDPGLDARSGGAKNELPASEETHASQGVTSSSSRRDLPPDENTFVESLPHDDLGDLLEDVGTEQSSSSALGALEGESDVGFEYQAHTKPSKFNRKKILLGAAAFSVLAFGIGALSGLLEPLGMPSYRDLIGKGDGYQAPSSEQLAQLNANVTLGNAALAQDRYDQYLKVTALLRQGLDVDARHRESLTLLVEIQSRLYEFILDGQSRKRINDYINVLDEHYSDLGASLRVKARFAYAGLQHPKAKSLIEKAKKLDPKDIEMGLLEGEIALKENQWAKALELLSKTHALAPKNIRAMFYLAETQRRLENNAEARIFYEKILNIDSEHPRAVLAITALDIDANQGASEELVILYESRLKAFENNLSAFDKAEAWRYLAEVSKRNGLLDDAISYMESSIKYHAFDSNNVAFLGSLYLERGDYAKASETFRKTLSIDPNNINYMLEFGKALRLAGEVNDSVTELKKALEKYKDHLELSYELGVSQRALSQPDDAVKTFRDILEREPDYLPALIEMGELLFEQNAVAQAKTRIEKALSFEPESARALNAMGKIYKALGQKEEALSSFQKAEQADPNRLETILNLGNIYLEINQLTQSKRYVEKAKQMAAGNESVRVALADYYLKRNDYNQAKDIYQGLIEDNPRSYESRIGLAKTFLLQNEPKRAIMELQEASKYKQEYFPIVFMLGQAWRAAGDLQSALDTLKHAQSLRPESPQVHFEIQTTYIYRNDIAKAQEFMQAAVQLDSTFIKPYMSMGDYYLSVNLYEKAAEYYNLALQQDPQNGVVLTTLGNLHRQQRKNDKAEAFYKRAVAVSNNSSEAYLGLGLLAEIDKNPPLAAQYYEKAKAIDALNPQPYYYLAFIYKEMGKKALAIQYFKRHLELNPLSKEKADLLDQIRRLQN